MKAVYIHADDERVGKTAAAASLANLARANGASAIVLKPFGAEDDPDVALHAALLGQDDAVEPMTGALDDDAIDLAARRCMDAASGVDFLALDGSASTPIDSVTRFVDALDAAVLGVARHTHGMRADRCAHWRQRFGDRLLGAVVNGRTRYQGHVVETEFLPALRALGVSPLGVIPEERVLLSPTINQVAEHLDGSFLLGEEYGDRLLQHFLVGGLGLDSGRLYFGISEDKGVIVRADRPDIQMAALQTPTACLILTGGKEPLEYVVHESELEETPIVLVESDTLTTMAALNDLQAAAAFDHADKLARYSALAMEHLDLAPVFDGVGAASTA